jgi:hypothetical protein
MRLDDYPMIPLLGEDEEWVEVRDFSEYLISNYGRVYSVRNDIVLKCYIDRDGYVITTLGVYGDIYNKKIHRVVAEAFVEGWGIDLQVNHIDGNKQNNHESNLEWVTKSENHKHAYRLGLQVPVKATKKVMIDNTGEIFNSINECAEFLDTQATNISAVLNGRRKALRGLTFSYVE